MPRTEPAPTWPLPTSWKIDFAVGKRRLAAPEPLVERYVAACSPERRCRAPANARRASPRGPRRRRSVRHPCAAGEPVGDAEREVEARDNRTFDRRDVRDCRFRASSRRGCRRPRRRATAAIQIPLWVGRSARPVDCNNQSGRGTPGRATLRRMPGELVLEARGLVKDYRRDRAVDGVDIVVARGRARRVARPERRGQDHDAADGARRRRTRRGRGHDLRYRPRAPAQPSRGVRRLRGGLPAADRAHARARVPAALRTAVRPRRSGAADRRRPRTVPDRASRRGDGHRAVVGATHAHRHRARYAAPPAAARARRADRVARPRRRPTRPRRACSSCAATTAPRC